MGVLCEVSKERDMAERVRELSFFFCSVFFLLPSPREGESWGVLFSFFRRFSLFLFLRVCEPREQICSQSRALGVCLVKMIIFTK